MASRHRKSTVVHDIGPSLIDQIADQPATTATLDIERFAPELHVAHRSELKKPEFYVKEIAEGSMDRLRKGVGKTGLLRPIIWNKRTGFVIDGWSTVGVLDEHMKHEDYRLRVLVVDLDKKQEREAHILLNNPQAQGFLSLEPLAKLFKDTETVLDIAATWFDVANIYQLMGDSPFAAEERHEELDALADKLRASQQQFENLTKSNEGRNADDYFTVLVFETGAERDTAHTTLGRDTNRWQNGREIAERVEMLVARLQQYEPNVTFENVTRDEGEDTTSIAVRFLDKRLATIESAADTWGSSESLELQTLLMLETRAVTLAIEIDVRREFKLYMLATLDNATSDPLWKQLGALSKGAELPTRLAVFRDTMVKRMDTVIEARASA